MRSATRKKIGKDKAYLEWLHTLACCVCLLRKYAQGGRTEAAHLGPRGLSTKSPDRQAIPLCRGHHEQLHKFGPRQFWEALKLKPEKLIADLNERFDNGERAE